MCVRGGGGGGPFKCHVGRRWDRRRRPFLKREKGLGRACSRDVGKRGALKIPGPTGGERAAVAGAAGGMMLQIGLMGKDQGNSLPPLHPAAKSRGERVDDDDSLSLSRPASPRQSTLFPRLPRSLNAPFGQGRDKRGAVTQKRKKTAEGTERSSSSTVPRGTPWPYSVFLVVVDSVLVCAIAHLPPNPRPIKNPFYFPLPHNKRDSSFYCVPPTPILVKALFLSFPPHFAPTV